jgi:topoisomerase-4 subunit B
MDPARRTLLKVAIADAETTLTRDTVERLMGSKPEGRFAFIQERAPRAGELVDI